MTPRVLRILRAIAAELTIYPLAIVFGSFFARPIATMYIALGTDAKWFASALMIPVTAAVASFSKMDDLLNPKGARRRLLDWPDYLHYKDAVQSGIWMYVLAFVAMSWGFYLVVAAHRVGGFLFMFAASVQTAFTCISLHLAFWRSREILSE